MLRTVPQDTDCPDYPPHRDKAKRYYQEPPSMDAERHGCGMRTKWISLPEDCRAHTPVRSSFTNYAGASLRPRRSASNGASEESRPRAAVR